MCSRESNEGNERSQRCPIEKAIQTHFLKGYGDDLKSVQIPDEVLKAVRGWMECTADRIIRDPDSHAAGVDAEDISHNVLICVLKLGLPDFDRSMPVKPYVCRKIRWAVASEAKKCRRERNFEQDFDPADDRDTSSKSVERNDRDLAIYAILRRLSSRARTAVRLHYWEGRSSAEIGAILGTKPSAVDGLLFRTRRKLKPWLEKFLD